MLVSFFFIYITVLYKLHCVYTVLCVTSLFVITFIYRRGAFLFQHVYHKRNNSHDIQSPNLISQNSAWRTTEATPAGKIRCKSIYRTDRALKIDLHFPYQLYHGYKEYIVDESDALLHHYRADPMETFRKHPEKFTYIWDDYMKMYGDELKQNYEKIINQLEKSIN